MTYSIVARDKQTGQMGVAVQTCNLAVGTWVPWAAGGVGLVATQALAERSYGTLGLDLMRGGKTAPDSLKALCSIDQMVDYRQVAMLDHKGNIAIHTGANCFPQAGSHVGDNFCTLANMMLRDTVWDAMADAYLHAQGDLAERLLTALYAAQHEGGDMRGQQTAALIVVDAVHNAIPLVDLRVDHDPDPLDKLRDLLRLHRAYMAETNIYTMANQADLKAVRQQLDRIKSDAPDEEYILYLRALHLAATLNEWDEAAAELAALIRRRALWRDYLEREAQVDNFGVPGLGARLLQALEHELSGGRSEQ